MEGFRDTTDGDLALSSHPDVHINSKLGPQLRKDLSTVPLGSLDVSEATQGGGGN